MDFSGWGSSVLQVILSGFGIIIWHTITKLKEHDKLMQDELNALKLRIAENYISKEDFNNSIRELKDILHDISNKLDKKADK
ncbi:MAG TPA: hypothetical protein VFM18_22170 [Methanosarcina sp.]|nr:hypothetical protein [Methanosarcina sp.]